MESNLMLFVSYPAVLSRSLASWLAPSVSRASDSLKNRVSIREERGREGMKLMLLFIISLIKQVLLLPQQERRTTTTTMMKKKMKMIA